MGKNIVGEKISTMCMDKNISIEELAKRSGLAVSQVKLLQNSDTIPSLGSLIKIARGLGVRVGTFLDDSAELGPVIYRPSDKNKPVTFSSQLSEANSHLDFISLAAKKSGRHMEPFLIDIQPTPSDFPILSTHEGEEFIYVLEGSIKVNYGSAEHVLHVGESIYYDSIVDHLVSAFNQESAKILAVVYTPV